MRGESEFEWDAVRFLLCAAEAKSLSGAARALGVEHTTVGRRLARLEQTLGCALVERKPSGLELTPLGRRAVRLAKEMDRLARSLAAIAAEERSHVKLVVPTGFTALLTPHLEVLSRKQPGVALDIVSGARRVDLRRGEADIAIRLGPVEDEGLITRKLGEVGMALYASRSYLARRRAAFNPESLRGHAVIGFHRSLSSLPAAQWLSARSEGASVIMRSREAADMITAARSGAGVAVLPCFMADVEPALVRLTDAVATRRVSLAYRREARLSPEVRAVIRFVIDTIGRQSWAATATPSI